MIDVRA